jgi:esterase/lipase superfamily enzyme
MKATCGRFGAVAGLSLLMIVILGCNAKPPPKDAIRPNDQSATTVEETESPVKSPTSTPIKRSARHGKSKTGKILYSKAEPDQEEADKDLPYSVVKVYYATDRSGLDVFEWRQSLRGGWPCLTVFFVLLTAVLMVWRRRRPGRILQRGLAWMSFAAALLLGGLTVVYYFQPDFDIEKIERMYGNDRGELELGTCAVSVPRDHRMGELESPTLLRLEFRPDPERHIVLLGVHPQETQEFYADLRKCIGETDRKEAFVFIHGYNVGFEEAVRRTAQIAYDLKFEGAPIAYCWPSQEGLLGYTIDETNVVWTVSHLKEFLCGVARQSGAKSVHLIAHSMGNRALTSALRELAMEQREKCPKFHEVILTAPDIDAEVFRRDLAPAIVNTADRVTLYASSNDEALIASRKVHGYLRAGESGKKIMVVQGVDTVDVSEVDTSFIGHSYYGSNTTVLADLFELMQGSKPPDKRKFLHSMKWEDLKYWKFLREKAVKAPPPGEEL